MAGRKWTGGRALALAALTAALAGVAAPASPGAAGAANGSWAAGCATAEGTVFDGVARLFRSGAAARRDGNLVREPVLNEVYETLPAGAQGQGGPRFRATIPVYFHVVSPDGVVGNVTRKQIDEQITAMNLGFGG